MKAVAVVEFTKYGTIFSTWDNYVDPLFQECYWLKED